VKRRAGLFCMMLVLLLLPVGNRDSVAVGGGGVVRLPDRIPLVALTFDDGPRPDTTGALLDGLALREVPATFFLVGERIEGSEELLLRMKQEGHQIGIHTYDHVLMTQLSRAEFEEQLALTRSRLGEVLGEGEYWLRPPYGIVNDDVLRWADGPLILWSVDPEDWKDRDEDRIVSSVLAKVEDGDIILMHDIYHSSVHAALRIVDELLEQGYCFVTVEQLMEVRQEQPEKGKVYLSLPPK